MALEQRNAQVSRLLGMMQEENQEKFAIGRGLHAMDFDSVGRNRRLGIGGGMASSLLSKKSGIIALVGATGLGLVALLTQFFDSKSDENEEPRKGMGQRIREWIGGKKEETAVDTSSSAPIALSHEISPLVPAGTEITKVKTAKSNQQQREALAAGAKESGVDYALLYAVAGSESSFRNDVAADTSTAVGLMQFTAPTWKYLVELLKLDYTDKDRSDPVKSSRVAGMYLNRIAKTLKKVLGRDPSYGETYLGYFLGPTGGANFLKALIANPNDVGADLFPRAAAANKNVFYSKGQALTLGQILAKLEGKIASYAGDAGSTALAKGQSSGQASAPAVAEASSTKTGQGQSAKMPTASAQPQTQAVSIPTNEVTNVKIKARQAETTPAQKVAATNQTIAPNAAAPSTESSAKMSSGNNSDALPFRGKDGRIYKG